MTMKHEKVLQAALLGLVTHVSAGITDDGLWDVNGGEWYDDTHKIGVMNGVPYSEDEHVNRRITSPVSVEGSVPDYMEATNVQRVQ